MADEFYTNKRDNLVKPLLEKFGAPVTLKVTSGEVFNETTGAVTGGSVSQFTVNGVVLSKRRTEKDSVSQDNMTLFMDAAGLTNAPTTSDRVVFASKEYEVVDVSPVMPGGVAVAYQITIREP